MPDSDTERDLIASYIDRRAGWIAGMFNNNTSGALRYVAAMVRKGEHRLESPRPSLDREPPPPVALDQ